MLLLYHLPVVIIPSYYQIDGKNKVTLALPTFAFVLSLYTVVSIVGIFIAHHLYKERRIISYFVNDEKDKLMTNSQWSKSHSKEWSDAKSISLPIILGIILSSLTILYAFSKETDTLVEDQKTPTAYELVEYAKGEISLPYTLEDSNIVIKDIVSETGNDVTYIYEVPDLSVSDIDKDEVLNGFCSEEDSYWRGAQKYNIQIIYKYIYEDGEIAIEPNENNCQ